MFLGMKGTGDFVNNQDPEDWRQTYLMLYPNGKAPLTAILSMMSKEKTSSPHFHWWMKDFPQQSAAVVDVWNDPILTIPYVANGVAGQNIYVRVALADVSTFIPGMVVLLRRASDLTLDVRGKVLASIAAGANSFITVMLLEADNNSATSTLANADVIWVIGNVHAEGSDSAISYLNDLYEEENVTQIFKNALEHTRTAMQTTLRTGPQVAQARKECLEFHNMDFERSLLLGIMTNRVGSNGKNERTTGGISSFLTTNVFDYSTDPTIAAGTTWLAGGENWLDNTIEQVARWSDFENKVVFCGSGAVQAINRIVKNRGTVELTQVKEAYGIQVTKWVTAFGTINLKTHPLLTMQATTRNTMVVVEPRYLKIRYIQDTIYQPEVQDNGLDGKKSQYLAEIGLELNLEQAHAWYNNVGVDHV